MNARRPPASPNRRRPGDAVLLFRWIVGLLAVAACVSFAMYIGTRERVWRDRGVVIVKWTVIAALGFFAVLILERLAGLL